MDLKFFEDVTDSLNRLKDIDKYKNIIREAGSTYGQTDTHTSGSITVVGLGIKSICQITLEVLIEIRRADRVFYLVDDTATELFLKDLTNDAFDLNMLSDDDSENEYSACVKMAELCLSQARKGVNVCVVLHGDSAISTMASQRIFQIASSTGIDLKTLPSVSLLDGIIADMEIDCSYGIINMNAVDFLLYYTPLDVGNNLVLRRLGEIAKLSNDSLATFRMFVEKLIQTYTEKHEVVHYLGVQYSIIHSPFERVTLSVLSNITQEQVNTIPDDSSLFVPVKAVTPVDASVSMQLGCLEEGTPAHDLIKRDLGLGQEQYGPEENQAIEDLKTFTIPKEHVWPTHDDVTVLLCEMSLNPNLLNHYKKQGNIQHDTLKSLIDCCKPESSMTNQMKFDRFSYDGSMSKTIKQTLVFYDNDTDDERDDASVSSSDSDFIREQYTMAPEEEKSPKSPCPGDNCG